jgi:predicted DNA-binding transcriptional regulator AlpA
MQDMHAESAYAVEVGLALPDYQPVRLRFDLRIDLDGAPVARNVRVLGVRGQQLVPDPLLGQPGVSEWLVNNLPPSANPLLALPAIVAMTGLSASTIKARRKAGTFCATEHYKRTKRWGARLRTLEAWMEAELEVDKPKAHQRRPRKVG